MPRRFLRGGSGRLALTVIALACGVALVCAMNLVNGAVLRAFVEIVDTMAGRAALRVTAGEGGLFPEETADVVAAAPGVALAAPIVTATAFMSDGGGELLSIHGIDLTRDAVIRTYQATDADGFELDDPLVFLSQPDSILLTRTFAAGRGIVVGDRIPLDTPTGRRQFVVRGLLDPSGVARVQGGNLGVLDLFAAEAAFTRPGLVNAVDVVVERDRDVQVVADAIRKILPPDLSVAAPIQRKADLHRMMQSLQGLLQGLGLIVLVAAFLIAFNRLSAVFEARTWQLGVLYAVGLRPDAVWRELIKESLLIGAGGVVLGVPLGIGLGHLLLPVVAKTTALSYNLVAPDARLVVDAWSILVAATLGLVAAAAAATLPARRAARAGAASAIRLRGMEQRTQTTAKGQIVQCMVFGGIVLGAAMQWASRNPMWGLLATAFIAIGTAVAARPLLPLVRRVALPALLRLSRARGRLATAAVLHNPRRVALTAATLGVGLGAVVWLYTMGRSFEATVTTTLAGVFRSDLVVSAQHVASGFLEAPLDDAILAELEAVPGVLAVAGERLIDWHYGGGPITINAFDARYFSDREFGQWPLVGRQSPRVWDDVARGVAVIVSSNFAMNLGVGTGDTIDFETPNGPLTVAVAGVTTDFASARGTVEMSRDIYQRYWLDHQVTRTFVRVLPGVDPGVVTRAITASLGAKYRLRVLSGGELVQYFADQVRRAFAAVPILASLMLLIVLVGMADTLAAGVTERARELGTIHAVGVRRDQLQRMVVVEALMIGILGLVLATVAGLALGTLWIRGTFPYLLGWVVELHVPYAAVAAVSAVALVVCLLAALLSARRVARLDPVVALRYD